MKGFIRGSCLFVLSMLLSQCLYGQHRVEAGRSISENEITLEKAVNKIVSADNAVSDYAPIPGNKLAAEYTVQVGAFSRRLNALKLADDFKTAGFKVDIYENYRDGKSLLYLVWIGSYKTVEELISAQKAIKIAYNIDGVIRERSVAIIPQSKSTGIKPYTSIMLR